MKSTKQLDAQMDWAKLVPLENITLLQGQYFDNSDQVDDRGVAKADTIKLNLYVRQWNIVLKENNPCWFRIIQLNDPDSVIRWAKAKHKIGDLTDDDLASYNAARELLADRNADDYEVIKMGHIEAPVDAQVKGTTGRYRYPGQFIMFTIEKGGKKGGPAALTLVRQGQCMTIPDWKYGRIKSRSTAKKAAKRTVLYDPTDILARQRKAQEDLEAYKAKT